MVRNELKNKVEIRLTAGAPPRNSCKVNGGGIIIALKVASGGLSGRGISIRAMFLALTNCTGLSVSGGTY